MLMALKFMEDSDFHVTIVFFFSEVSQILLLRPPLGPESESVLINCRLSVV